MNARERGEKQREVRQNRAKATSCATTLALLIILVLATVAVAASTVTFYKHVINFPNPGEVTYLYNVTSTSDPAISHTTFAVESCYQVTGCGQIIDGEYIATECEVGLDPTTGIDGVKFEDEVEPGDAVTYWFTVASDDQRIGDTQAATKAGRDVVAFDVSGPVCDPNVVALTALTAQQKDNAVWNGIAYALMVAIVAVAVMYILKRTK